MVNVATVLLINEKQWHEVCGGGQQDDARKSTSTICAHRDWKSFLSLHPLRRIQAITFEQSRKQTRVGIRSSAACTRARAAIGFTGPSSKRRSSAAKLCAA